MSAGLRRVFGFSDFAQPHGRFGVSAAIAVRVGINIFLKRTRHEVPILLFRFETMVCVSVFLLKEVLANPACCTGREIDGRGSGGIGSYWQSAIVCMLSIGVWQFLCHNVCKCLRVISRVTCERKAFETENEIRLITMRRVETFNGQEAFLEAN